MILISVVIGCAIFGVALLIGVAIGTKKSQPTKEVK